MNTQRVLQQITTGDRVSFEAHGRPAVYEGVVVSRGPYSMTVALDDSARRLGIRFESIDYVTVRKTSTN